MKKDLILHLQIIYTWAAVGKNYNGIEPRCCQSVEEWAEDAISELKRLDDMTLKWNKLSKKSMPEIGESVLLWLETDNDGFPVTAYMWPDGRLRYWNVHGETTVEPSEYRKTRWARIYAPEDEQ